MINAAAFHTSRHLEEEHLLPPEPACPLCGGSRREEAWVLQRHPAVHLLTCSDCGGASASRMPTEAALQSLYAEYYTGVDRSGIQRKARVTFNEVSRFGRHLAGMIQGRQSARRPRILDFGGGDGLVGATLAGEWLAAGADAAEVVLVDFNDKVTEAADARVTVTHCPELESAGEGFDAVLASAVLEHLARPRPVLDRLLGKLAPGGIFYARTPWALPLMRTSARFGVRWDFTYPTHLHDLGQTYWDGAFANRPEFEVLASRPSLVETTFRRFFLRTLAAHTLKAPWRLFGNRWPWVGGWEIFARRRP